MTIALAFTATVFSSACFGVASVLEQVGAKRTQDITGLDFRQAIALVRQAPYSSGLLLDVVGFLTFLIAVRALPLFFVEAVSAGSIAVTALSARFISKVQLTAKEYWWIGVLIAGLGVLAYATPLASTNVASEGLRYGCLAVALVMGATGGLLVRYANTRTVLLGLAGGICFSGVSVTSRILPVHGTLTLALFINPTSIALAIFGLLGMMLFSVALQKGSVTQTYAITFLIETILPTIIGILLLGDQPRAGLWPVMIVGISMALAGIVAIASSKEYVSHA